MTLFLNFLEWKEQITRVFICENSRIALSIGSGKQRAQNEEDNRNPKCLKSAFL